MGEAREKRASFVWRGGTCCGIELAAEDHILRLHQIFHSEFSFMRRSLVIAAFAATLLGALTSAEAQAPVSRVQVGVLECRGGASVGFIVGSVTHLGCVLR